MKKPTRYKYAPSFPAVCKTSIAQSSGLNLTETHTKPANMGDPNITRLLPADRRRGPRLEIDEFIGDNEMTNLFLIAMSNLQQNSYKLVNNKPVWTNWYGIGGKHGDPHKPESLLNVYRNSRYSFERQLGWHQEGRR